MARCNVIFQDIDSRHPLFYMWDVLSTWRQRIQKRGDTRAQRQPIAKGDHIYERHGDLYSGRRAHNAELQCKEVNLIEAQTKIHVIEDFKVT